MHTKALIKNVPVTFTASRSLYGYTVYGYSFDYMGQPFLGNGYHSEESARKEVSKLIDRLEAL